MVLSLIEMKERTFLATFAGLYVQLLDLRLEPTKGRHHYHWGLLLWQAGGTGEGYICQEMEIKLSKIQTTNFFKEEFFNIQHNKL